MNFNTVARLNRAGTFNIAMDELSYTTLLDLTTLDLQSISIRQGLQEMYPRASLKIFGEYEIDTSENIAAHYITTDHLGVDNALFIGMLLSSSWTYDPGNDLTSIQGYGLGYFESMQYVPEQFTHNYASINPAVTMYGLTGGDEWAGSGGVEPYRIMPVSAWGTTLNSRVFDFDRLCTIKNAVEKICDYTRHVHLVQSALDTYSRPVARRYFVHEDDLDTYMDLPAAVTITNPDSHLKGGVTVESKGEEVYNYIVVMGRDTYGNSLSAVKATDDAIQGNVPLKIYPERSGAFTTQAQVQARADELYGFYVDPASIYSATLLDRMDLRLLQKLQFSGYASFTSDWMRITDVDYTVAATGDGIEKSVKVQFTSDAKFSNIRRMYRCATPDPVGEVGCIFDAKVGQMPGNEMGTVVAVDESTNTATVELDDGRTVEARNV
jgi:hypothetical protein